MLCTCLLLLILTSGEALAQGYEVESSSRYWMSTRDYSAMNLADNDPETVWAEGGEGAGEGESVTFTFAEPVRLARLAIRNGDQGAGRWDSCNRVHVVRVDRFTDPEADADLHGQAELRDIDGVQYIVLDGKPVSKVRLTIVSAYSADNFWNRSVTCLSDIGFEAYLGEQPAPASAAAPEDAAPADAQAAPAAEPAVQTSPAASPEPVQEAAPEESVEEPAQEPQMRIVELKRVELPEPPPLPEPNRDLRAEAIELVRQYYLRLNTLDETFPDLMAAKVYDQELFSFLYFQEIQKQLGTADKLREANIDLAALKIEPEKLNEAAATVRARGGYTVGTPGQRLMLDEDALFSLVMEDGTWKILKKTDEDD